MASKKEVVMRWKLSPRRVREVWLRDRRATILDRLLGRTEVIVVYWDIDRESGLSFPRSSDRVGEPDYVSYYRLLEYGWRRG